MRVFQHIDVFHSGDGIGNDILGISEILNSLKIKNYIITRKSEIKKKFIFENPVHIPYSPNDLHIIHYGGYGYPVMELLTKPGKKILRFHNITPPGFFLNFLSPSQGERLEINYKKARFELISILDYVEEVWTDSDFNAETLISLTGTKNFTYKTIPIFRQYIKKELDKTNKEILFIGRWSPNKKLEDLFYLIYYLKKIDKDYKLVLIGKKNNFFSKYNSYLISLIKDLDIENSIEILDDISEDLLFKKLAKSPIYLSMSEHEGFGIPLLEAMGMGSIILAFKQKAVSETLRGAGVLFTQKDFRVIAEFIDYLIGNKSLKDKILKKQFKSLEFYNQYNFSTAFSNYI